jgi:hypothetical protein
MTGQSHWLDLATVFFGVLVVPALILVLRWLTSCHVRQVKRTLACPFLHREVECTLARDVATGLWIDVCRCSAFPSGSSVGCDKECLRCLHRGETPT